MSKKLATQTRATVLLDNPLAGEELLLDAMYGPAQAPAPRRPRPVEREPVREQQKPQHYKIISISLYNEDIVRLDRMVTELKKRGHYKASKSQLIRVALAQLEADLDRVPKDDVALGSGPGSMLDGEQ